MAIYVCRTQEQCSVKMHPSDPMISGCGHVWNAGDVTPPNAVCPKCGSVYVVGTTAEDAVDAALVGSVIYSVVHVGAGKRADQPEWECDTWHCTFTKNGTAYTFSYYTGLGNRAKPTKHDRQKAMFDFPGLNQYDIDTRSIYGKRYLAAVEKLRKPVAPRAASVLYSLLRDGEAIHQSFDDWCGDFGYDSDSRKALATYEACCESGKKLRKLFTSAQRETLSNLLQDY